MSATARQRWLASYGEQLLTRDASEVDSARDPARLRKYFEAYALNTAGTVADKALHDAAGINRKTALAYERLLGNLLVVEALPAWSSNRLKRLTLTPKRHVVDPGLLAGALGIDVAAVMAEGDLLGRILESFVAAHLRAEAAVADARPRLYHVRTEQGRHEIEILAEVGAGRVVAFEVKASAAPDASAAAHSRAASRPARRPFRGRARAAQGRRSYALGERLSAVPISTF